MITTKRPNYETEEEEFAFGDGFVAGIDAMCEKYNINKSEVYKKEELKKDEKTMCVWEEKKTKFANPILNELEKGI